MHVIDLEVHGLIGDSPANANAGIHDNSPAWNAIIPTVQYGDTLVLPPNYVSFRQPILPLPSGVKLIGPGSVGHMVRNFSQGNSDFFLMTGALDSWVEGVRLWAADGTTGGRAIGRHGQSPDDAPFHTVLQHIEITRFNTGRWFEGVHLDGGLLGAPHYGSRRHQGDAIIISGVDDTALWLGGCVSCNFTRLIAGAGNPRISVFLVGYQGINPCNEIYIDGPIDGQIILYATVAARIETASASQIVTDLNCASCTIEAAFLNSAAPWLLGDNNHVYANGKHWKSTPTGGELV